MRRVLRSWLFAGALFGAAAHAAAATPLATLSIIDAGSVSLARKLRAEAAYAGFITLGVVADGGPPLHATEPVAVLRVVSASRVELRAPALDGRVNTLELARAEGEGDSFALRVIEQLRASLVDLGWQVPVERSSPGAGGSATAAAAEPPLPVDAEPGPPATPQPSEPSLSAASAATARSSSADTALLSAHAGMAASWAAGGIGVMPHALLGLRGRHETRWGASLTALLPLAERDVVAAEGEARVSWSSFAAALDHALPLPAPWFASAGLGAGLLVMDVRGEASPGFEGRQDRSLAGSYFVELCAGGRLASWLALRTTLLTGVNAPRPVLEFDARDVASLGRPFGVLGLSADVGLIPAPIEPP